MKIKYTNHKLLFKDGFMYLKVEYFEGYVAVLFSS